MTGDPDAGVPCVCMCVWCVLRDWTGLKLSGPLDCSRAAL